MHLWLNWSIDPYLFIWIYFSVLFSMQVHVTLTTDSGKLLSKLNLVQPKGELKFLNGLRVAHLALKHRQSKNHKCRIVAFVGSPITEEEKEVSWTQSRFYKHFEKNIRWVSEDSFLPLFKTKGIVINHSACWSLAFLSTITWPYMIRSWWNFTGLFIGRKGKALLDFIMMMSAVTSFVVKLPSALVNTLN